MSKGDHRVRHGKPGRCEFGGGVGEHLL
jgi:hypothetical protein